MNGEKAAILLAMVALVGWMIFLLYRRNALLTQATLRRIEIQNRLIDRFGTAPELAAFLTTRGASALEEGLPEATPNPLLRALGAIQVSVVLFMVGVGFLVNAWLIGAPVQFRIDRAWDFIFWGVMFVASALGFFLIGGLTRILARKWELIDTDRPRR